MVAYVYELPRGDAIVATGRVTVDEPLGIGDEVVVGEGVARVVDVLALVGETRLILEGEWPSGGRAGGREAAT